VDVRGVAREENLSDTILVGLPNGVAKVRNLTSEVR
jgi:hypothetical protein